MGNVIDRAGWGAREPRATTPIDSTANVVIHYEGNDSAGDVSAVQAIQNYHMDRNGWNDIAYNFLVNQAGDVFEGRGWGVRSAANGSIATNRDRYAMCFMIGPDTQPSEAALQAARDLVGMARAAVESPREVTGHRDHIATSCPGQPLYDLIQSGAFEPDFGQVFINDVPVVENPPMPNPLAELADGVLSVGEHGVWVKILQERLISLGFNVGSAGADGDYGFDTAQAVKQFQVEAGITGDGVAGRQTFSQLDEWEANKRHRVPKLNGFLKLGSKGEQVKEVQRILNLVAGAGLVEDGVFGPATEKAVKAFQTFFGAASDGIVGSITWALLHGSPTYEVH